MHIKNILWNQDNKDIDKITKEINTEKITKEIPSETAENINPPENKKDDYWDYIKMDMLYVDFNE